MAQALMGRFALFQATVTCIQSTHLLRWKPQDSSDCQGRKVRDGGSFSTRRVIVQQEGRPIFTLDASFQVEEKALITSSK